MKNLLLFPALLMAGTLLLAQAPELISYQAVVRDINGELITNSDVGIQISVLYGDPAGQLVYAESHTPFTNENGLLSIQVGGGYPLSGTFEDIEWADGPFFLHSEIDPEGGRNYSIQGSSQILSVPYALYAREAGELNFEEEDPVFSSSAAAEISQDDIDAWNTPAGGPDEDGDPENELQYLDKKGDYILLSHGGGSVKDSVNQYQAGEGIDINGLVIGLEDKLRIGDLHMGGIVFYLDRSGKHGLVASLHDLDDGEGTWWIDTPDLVVGEPARSASNGMENTNAILGAHPGNSAAALCRALGPEWYLPANRELYQLFSHELLIDEILDNDGDPASHGLIQEKTDPTQARYWSSTEQDHAEAWAHKAASGDTSPFPKGIPGRVRAIRAF